MNQQLYSVAHQEYADSYNLIRDSYRVPIKINENISEQVRERMGLKLSDTIMSDPEPPQTADAKRAVSLVGMSIESIQWSKTVDGFIHPFGESEHLISGIE